MCIAAPARVVELDGGTAVVEAAGRRHRASLLMVPDAEVGEWVLVAAGNVVRRIDATEAAALASELRSALAAAASAGDQGPPSRRVRPGGSR